MVRPARLDLVFGLFEDVGLPDGHAVDDGHRADERPGVRVAITRAAAYRPLDVGMHVLAELRDSSLASGAPLFGKLSMFHATGGTTRLHAMLERGVRGDGITASWGAEVERFRRLRAPYLIY
jgi:hypothetical protein